MRFLLLVRLTLKLLPNELALPWSYKLQKRLMFLLVCYVANGGKSTGKKRWSMKAALLLLYAGLPTAFPELTLNSNLRYRVHAHNNFTLE